jgi:NAD(P)-dependent dehydrogenase (short-subunit alcohol dehydrogenase family)
MFTPQMPIGSTFTAHSTAEDVIRGIDLSGKVAIVTGGYSGLGLETVRVFLDAGARVIVPARNLERARAQMAGVEGAELMPMDLLDPASIDAFADSFIAMDTPLHILVNSAGIMAVPELRLDARGYEIQFATNHLGHFQLVSRLWSALVAAKGARVVSVASLGHCFAGINFDDPSFERRAYAPWLGYGQSKTANVLFAVELDKRGQSGGVRALALHPGGIPGTGLEQYLDPADLIEAGILDAAGKPILDADKGVKTIAQGTATQVWCAVSPQLDGLGGVYCENVEIAEVIPASAFHLNGSKEQTGVMAHAVDRDAAAKLWTLSEQMLGIRFGSGDRTPTASTKLPEPA